jgi:hypothetical protein
MTGTYKSIDSNTYEVYKIKSKLMMRCLTCTTKDKPVEITEDYLNKMIKHKTMIKL